MKGHGSAFAYPTHASKASQPKHEQHRVVTLFLELGREHVLADGDAAEPRQDCDVLLAAHLEGHRRRVEARADVDLPELLQRRVVKGSKRSIGETGEDETAGGGQCAAIVRVRYSHS